MIYSPRDTSVSLQTILSTTGGTAIGDSESCSVTGICSLDEQKEGCIAFSTLSSAEAVNEIISSCKASALLLRASLQSEITESRIPLVFVQEPLAAMVALIPLFFEFERSATSISDKADVAASAEIAQDVSIAAFASIGERVKIGEGASIYPHVCIYPDAVIGKGAIIHAGAVIRERCVVGENCVIQNGAVVGADGFGYFPTPKGLQPVPQIGITELADEVDIGANSCIDRATLGTTSIGRNSKVDNLAQIGHNVRIGQSTVICGDVAIGGSTKIGNGVTLAGAVSLADHLIIDDGVRFAGRAAGGHIRHYKKDDYMGYPALPAKEWLRMQTSLRRLPELRKQVKRLERALEASKGE